MRAKILATLEALLWAFVGGALSTVTDATDLAKNFEGGVSGNLDHLARTALAGGVAGLVLWLKHKYDLNGASVTATPPAAAPPPVVKGGPDAG